MRKYRKKQSRNSKKNLNFYILFLYFDYNLVLTGDARDQRCFHLLFLRAVDAANQGFDASFRVKLAQRQTGGAYSAKQREQIEAPRPEQELQGRREHEQLELDLQPQEPRASNVVVEAIEQQMEIVPFGGCHVGDVQAGAAG